MTSSKPRPQVSIVVPAFNEEKYITNCLNSLAKQQTKYKYQVILVDNNSTDQTVALANQFKSRLNLKIIREQKQGRGPARWAGFKAAQTEIVMSADADAIYPPDWVERFTQALVSDDQIVAVTGSCRIVDCSKSANFIFNLIQPKSMRLYRVFLGHFWLSGFSFGIHKSIYDQSGGFNHLLQAEEDIDLSFKVSKLGKIHFINHPIIFSGRRFQNRLWAGFLEYITLFFRYKKKDVYLSNIR